MITKKQILKDYTDMIDFVRYLNAQQQTENFTPIRIMPNWADARFLCKRCGKIKPVGKGNDTKKKICAACKRKKAVK